MDIPLMECPCAEIILIYIIGSDIPFSWLLQQK